MLSHICVYQCLPVARNMVKPMMVDLVRHGDVSGRQHVARGVTDNPLSDEGWQQLKRVKTCIGKVDVIGTSPLKRCREFAESCDEPVQILQGMQEIDFGDWEDKSAEEVNNTERLNLFFESPMQFQAPNGEAFECFSRRVILTWNEWIEMGSSEHRLLLAHGCVIRVILAHVLGLPQDYIWRMVIDPAGWTRISLMEGEQPRILFMNRVCHE